MNVLLSLVLSVLAAALVIIFFRLRKKESAAAAPSAPSQRPVIAANVQRKVA